MSETATFLDQARALESELAGHPVIRAVNFHNTPRSRADEFDRQLAWCAERYSAVDEDDLDRYLKSGRWHKRKPGVIVALYNGYRDNYDVFLPLLARHSLVGWFFAASGFVSAPPAEQIAFAERSSMRTVPGEYPDGRYALSWSELKEIDRRHVVASHTRNHARLSVTERSRLEGEIVGAQQDFEQHLGHPVRSFASLSGAPYGADAETDLLVKRAGYRFVFSNFKIQRVG